MNREEFANLKVGDIVEITQHGKNKGKRGIVSEIRRDINRYGGIAYLTPIDCEFEFYEQNIKLRRVNKDGLYPFPHESIRYAGPKSDKTFYIGQMYITDGIFWSTKNFTESELKVIDRFLKEFNEKASGLHIDDVAILDKEE